MTEQISTKILPFVIFLLQLSLPFAIYFNGFSLVSCLLVMSNSFATGKSFLSLDHEYLFAGMQSRIAKCCFAFQNQVKANRFKFDIQKPFQERESYAFISPKAF